MKTDALRQILSELLRRPGHEKVRALFYKLLVDGLGAESRDVDFEKRVPEVRGRIDALIGRTVIEFKSKLHRERAGAEEELGRYLPDRERATGLRFVGLATDGAECVVYAMQDGTLTEVGSLVPDVEDPRAFLAWLDSVVVVKDELAPDHDTVRRELGRKSLAYARAFGELSALWQRARGLPEVTLKRDLWQRLLRVAYDGEVEDEELFLQHTYLTVVAKAIVTAALLDDIPDDAGAFLSGAAFRERASTARWSPTFSIGPFWSRAGRIWWGGSPGTWAASAWRTSTPTSSRAFTKA